MQEVRTFKDMQDLVIYLAKLSDTTAVRNDLKRLLNLLYQKLSTQEYYRWAGAEMALKLPKVYSTGTISVTQDSDEITGSSTVWTEFDHRFAKMKIGGLNVPLKILRVASNTSITVEAQWTDSSDTGVSYQIFRDEFGLFPDLQDIRQLRIPGMARRLQPGPVGPSTMDEYRDRYPFTSGPPRGYTIHGKNIYTAKTWADWNLNTDFWEDDYDVIPRNKNLIVWPGVRANDYIAKVRYTKMVPLMDADTDEPLMDEGFRGVLPFGVLALNFLKNRDIRIRREWKGEYNDYIRKLASDIESIDDELILSIDRRAFKWRSAFNSDDMYDELDFDQ